ncbi:MAG TPA: hypothetical protein VL443_20720 [Cyclobacteriaceae bacterium]|jgi:hypothetical protein|nr:hypothetical protein [Cyclobacteriaceae bacterium]
MFLRNIALLAFFLLTSCSINQQKNDKDVNHLPMVEGCIVSPEIRSMVRNIMNSDTIFSKFVIDSTVNQHCVQGNSLAVYFLKITNLTDGYETSGYVGFCLDTLTKRHSQGLTFFTQDMMELSDSAWDESIRLLTEPRLSLVDLKRNDDATELVVKERVENGTLYHAVIDRFYEIDPQTLSLSYKFSIESLSWVPIREVYIQRLFQNNCVRVYESKTKFRQEKLIGEYCLEPGSSQPEGVAIHDEEYKDFILTSSPTEEILPPETQPY